MTEVMLTPATAKAGAMNAMQATMIADGMKRLGRDTLPCLKQSGCFVEVWSPELKLATGKLQPLRFYITQVVDEWRMQWCDDQGGHVQVNPDTPIYVSVRYAGEENYPLAVQLGAATELLLANKGYCMLDNRQHDSLRALIECGKLSNSKGKK